MITPLAKYTHAPGAELDYTEDWSAWLKSGETLVDADWVVASGDGALTIGTTPPQDATFTSAGVATAWLIGGTVSTSYDVQCTVTTSAGRIDARTIRINVATR